MKTRYFLVILFSAVIFTGCDDDEGQAPKGQYEEGVFVANEGLFGSGNGSVTHYSTSGVAEQNIFRNSVGDFAGDVVQSLTFDDDVAFLVVNGDNKIEVVNSNTFKSIRTITDTDIDKPRYVQVIGDKAYISVWGAYDENFSLVDSYVLVYDLATQAVVKKIDTDEGTENLVYDGDHIFASNFNYGASSTVSVIDPSDNTFVKDIDVAAGPAGSVIDANGKIWVVCVGGFGAESGQLFRINGSTLEVEDEILITDGAPGVDIALTPNGQNIMYTVGASVYSVSIAASTEPDEPVFTAEDVISLAAMNVDPATGNIWIGDAPTFTGIGKVYIYEPDGDKITSFDAGIGPTQIVFK